MDLNMNLNISSTFQYWLVKHPVILHFSWIPGETPASTPLFLTLTIISYLALTFLLSHLPLPLIKPRRLKPITAFHNLNLLLLSLVMAVGSLVSIFSYAPYPFWIICLPPKTPPTGPLFFWAYIFYLSKIYEFVDTFLIILSGSFQRLTFLHVYHHTMVLVMCYIWLHTSQSLFPAVIVANGTVHVVMYTYYLLAALGARPKWKRRVTEFQIFQFMSSFVGLVWMLIYHFNRSAGCSGIWGWCFNIFFYVSLLALFMDFHHKSYGSSKKDL
ncbi:hypothetical protein ACFX13_020422 [Malus domestica]|uniref:very-long-chain 3-oxoacyl-CoA synthase n=1 Tax=Malus baccata TaxID=106549 RepID=A0A540LNC5_MALBA|nr:elongation of fatty acids protein A-like [Malus domestica]XP_050124369.1 uncharacterized protein LOC126601672 [Malus sylvestris]TQD87990.1 hypothetical protein C1H46_026488 [Malus baccata]